MTSENTRKSRAITDRQRQVLEVLKESIATRGYPPSVREIAELVGLSAPSSAKHQLDALEKLGFIRRTPGLPRAIEIITDEDDDATPTNADTLFIPISESTDGDTTTAPLVGRIAAGAPITAEQSVDDIFTLPERLTGRGELFALEVSGDSMVEAAICDGDFVVVRRQPSAEDGEIVAAMIDGEATVKVLSHNKSDVWLLPRNKDFDPIPGNSATILGKVVTVIRAI
ncbi:transcriptional repressor LexA [Actinomyces sp.]|uniref:transcriptional repressor LexA n=1 Tax=Actinomyces sp. TaxID=29317 RepID=UPI001EC7BAD5|nr:transcriptional repressor LexA [Actinomyces sp.]MBS5826126.1 transcriptional repressor LexA [Actinomyces sp.]MDU5231395.1 transcriptional repressor LexA [Actinomyces sp.]MDU6757141.1 transcriptional repressor LexA [Actinomyces sp.]